MTRQCKSLHWSDGQTVVEGREINPNHAGPLPRFGDDVWDLRCITFTRNTSPLAVTLDFSKITCPELRLVAKDFIAQRLTIRLVNTRSGDGQLGRISAKTAFNDFMKLRTIIRFMSSIGIARLPDLTPEHLDAFLTRLMQGSVHEEAEQEECSAPGERRTRLRGPPTPSVCKHYLLVFDRLRDAHSHLTGGGLAFDPWPGQSLARLVGERLGEENRTERIDERVMGPLAAWSLAYVETFSEDILRAARVYMGWHRTDEPRTLGREGERKLEDWAVRLRERGGAVPATRIRNETCPSTYQIAYEAGVASSVVTRRMELVTALGRERGLDLNTFGVYPITPEGAPGPWRGPIDARAITSEIRHLVEACYVIIAFLSGMRDSEAQGLKPGCLRITRDEFGLPERFLVDGLIFKESLDAAGDPHTWTVTPEVANAIGVLERLSDVVLGPGVAETLFVMLSRSKGGRSIADNIGPRLNHFIDYIATELAPRLVGYLPSLKRDADVLDWHVATSQFRRTLAYYIGAQPFGSAALQIQYGHKREIISEGYIGRNTASGFASEIEREHLLAAEQDVVSMYEDSLRGIHQAGPMGAEIEAEFASVAHLVGDATFRGKVLDTRTRDEKLRHVATRLHPGVLVDCVFERSRAQCLRDGEARTEPIIAACDMGCQNSLWRKRHLPMLEANLTDVKAMLARRLNNESKHQKRILRDHRDRLSGMISDVRARCGEQA